MINARRLFKAGRKTKIFEVSDNLQVNDFYNVTGYQHSSQEGKMSRIKIVIVDVTKGSKSAANVDEFNLKTNEWINNISLIRDSKNFSGDKFIRISKANPYKKIGSLIEVKHLKISFEDKLIVPKWKFEITTGTAMPKKDGFGYDSKTFKKINVINFLLDIAEVIEMIDYINEYISNWKKATFSQYLENRQAFIKRLVENDYNEETIETWNNNPYSRERSHYTQKANTTSSKPMNDKKINNHTTKISSYKSVATSNANKSKSVGNPQLELKCSTCGKNIDENQAQSTKELFGIILCRTCLMK